MPTPTTPGPVPQQQNHTIVETVGESQPKAPPVNAPRGYVGWRPAAADDPPIRDAKTPRRQFVNVNAK